MECPNGQMVGATFIDIRRALDTVNHYFFVESLRDMGSKMMKCVGLCLILQVESNRLLG